VLDAATSRLQMRYDQPGIARYCELERDLFETMTADKVNDALKDHPELSRDSLLVQLAMVRQQQWDVDSIQGYIEKMKSLHYQTAGKDWLWGFMRRHHPTLVVRSQQATILSRATSFNRTNVGTFFDNLLDVCQRYKFQPHQIYNVDETGVQTVLERSLQNAVKNRSVRLRRLNVAHLLLFAAQ